MHNSFLAFLCLCFCTVLKGQALYGTSGLLHMPTADMQKDKTVCWAVMCWISIRFLLIGIIKITPTHIITI